MSAETPGPVAVSVPAQLQPYVEYATYTQGRDGPDGVVLMLTREGVKYARRDANRGSHELARWLMSQPLWHGNRTPKNVADEISTHALYVGWPLLGKRANPVNIEYFQRWPGSLVLVVRDRALAAIKRRLP